jgi:integrase
MARRTTGVVAHHTRGCRSREGGTCNCTPTSFEAWIFDPRSLTHGRRCASSKPGGQCDCEPKRGAKIRKTFPTLAAAKGWRVDAGSALRKGTLKAPTRLTVEQAAETWLEGAKGGTVLTRSGRPYKPGVIRGYEADLRRYVFPDLGAHRLSELRRSDLQALVDRMVSAGRSASKIHNVVMPIRVLCRHAIERDELLVNPTTNLRLPVANGRRERVSSPQETAELIEALPEEQRCLWWTAALAGLRRGELRALRWSDIDLEANVIVVERSWDEKEGPVDPKSEKSRRRVPIPASLRRHLLEHKLRTGRDGDDLVFGRTADRPFTPTHVRKIGLAAWENANKERREVELTELRPIGLHELRHSYVSLMHDAGFSLERIGDYVGHSSAYMTDRYRHLIEGHEAEAAGRFETYLNSITEAARR